MENMPATPADTALDPVCGMTVNVATAKHRRDHAGKTYYFCSPGCAHKFSADAEGYLSAGMNGVVEKPMKPEHLLAALQQALGEADATQAAAAA